MRLETVEQLGPRAAAWDELVDAHAVTSSFLRSWWVDHAAGGRPQVLCCFDGDELVGGMALETDLLGRAGIGIERVRVLGHGVLSPDLVDVVARPDSRDAVLDAVVGWLRRPGSRLIDLDGIIASSELPDRLGATVLERQVCPYMTLPAEPAAALKALPGRLRSTIKRSTKRLGTAGFTSRRVPVEESARALDDLARLHEDRWQDGSKFLEVWSRFAPVALRGAESGDVAIYEMAHDDGTVIAVELDVLTPDRSGFYQAGRSTADEHRGAGTALKWFAVADAIESGRREYDLLRGDESYKADWATGVRDQVRVVAHHGAAGQAVRAAGLGYIAVVGPVLDKRAERRQARSTEPERTLQAAAGGAVTTDDRVASEQRFHDERFGAEEPRRSDGSYAITGASAAAYHDLVSGLATGARVLELGCGDNTEAWELAATGSEVVAIDISQVAVDAATERATEIGLDGVSFRQMNAEALEFDDSEFDLVIGSGILHHLDTPVAMEQIARVLRPHGHAAFIEPLGHNPLLRAYRRVTPGERTPDEHPLLRSDLDALSNWFGSVELQFFHLMSLGALAFTRSQKFESILARLDRADRSILGRSALAQDLAWFVVIHVSEPKALKGA